MCVEVLNGRGTLTRSLDRHPYSDTLNRPTSVGHVAATIPLAGNTQLPTDSAEEPHLFGAPSDRHDEIRASTIDSRAGGQPRTFKRVG